MNAPLASAPPNHRFDTNHVNLLFATTRFFHVLRGDRLAEFCRAWVQSALGLAAGVLDQDETALPASPREALLALHKASLDLCARAGVNRVELTAAYNEHGESGTFENGGIGEAAERALALLALFHARRLQGVP